MQISPVRQQNILIAGCGDIGITLARKLIQQGHRVHGLRRNINQLPTAIHGISADLNDPSQLRSLPAIDILVYCVSAQSRDEGGYRRAYVEGMRNLMFALQNQSLKRVFFVSSSAVYAQDDDGWVDETSPTEPTRFNGRILLQAEQQVLKHHVPGTVIRFSGIYGPGRSHLLGQVFHGKGYANEPLQYSNRIHRDDCAGVLAHLINKQGRGEPLEDIYLASDGHPCTLHEVSHWLAAQMGRRLTDLAPPREGGSKRCSNQRLLDSGYRFLYPGFRDGYMDLISTFMAAHREF